MARCTYCGYAWKAKEVWQLGLSKNGKECPNCQTRQFVSFKGGGFLTALGYLSGTVGLLLIVFFPFYVNLSSKEETSLNMDE